MIADPFKQTIMVDKALVINHRLQFACGDCLYKAAQMDQERHRGQTYTNKQGQGGDREGHNEV
jgi:hypothetical protein